MQTTRRTKFNVLLQRMKNNLKTQNKPWQRIETAKLADLQTLLDNRIGRWAQLQFYEHVLKVFTEEKEKKSVLGLVPSHYFFADAVKIGLHFRLYYKTHKFYENVFGVPETTASRIFEWTRQLVLVV